MVIYEAITLDEFIPSVVYLFLGKNKNKYESFEGYRARVYDNFQFTIAASNNLSPPNLITSVQGNPVSASTWLMPLFAVASSK